MSVKATYTFSGFFFYKANKNGKLFKKKKNPFLHTIIKKGRFESELDKMSAVEKHAEGQIRNSLWRRERENSRNCLTRE